jgi:GNAT superfamily N-acetyltransferase
MTLRVITCTGEAVSPHLNDLSRLRIAVFRDYPYLYDGDIAYERDYLYAYARSARSVFVLAFDGDTVVGASSGIPLDDDGEAFQQPFRAQGIAVEEVFYFGESVLLNAYRGQGIGHRFFDEREAHARRLGGFRTTAFCSVERATDDSRRPAHYRSNDAFWRKRGYQRQDAMFCRLDWKEIGDAQPTPHRLRFWLRPLDDRSGRVDG